jgi:hypothetical protein
VKKNQKVWLWVSAAVSMVVGFILVLKGSGAGWFLIILGIVDIGASTDAGDNLAVKHPLFTRWSLIILSFLLILLTVIILSVMNMK